MNKDLEVEGIRKVCNIEEIYRLLVPDLTLLRRYDHTVNYNLANLSYNVLHRNDFAVHFPTKNNIRIVTSDKCSPVFSVDFFNGSFSRYSPCGGNSSFSTNVGTNIFYGFRRISG